MLLITLDGLRQDHLSLFGYARETSPVIDRLGRAGVAVRTLITTGSSTKASLTSLFTAMDYRYHHVIEHGQRLPDEFVTLAERFRDAGYFTAAVTATPMLSGELNYDQGFLVYEDFARVPGAKDSVRADRVAQRMVEVLERLHQGGGRAPFFLYAHFEEPHPPWFAPSPWLDEPLASQHYEAKPFDRGCGYVPTDEELRTLDQARLARWIAQYDGAILQADHAIGQVIDWLERQNLLASTIVAVSTDHGYDLLDRWAFGHGHGITDAVVRTFLIVHDGSRPEPEARTLEGVQARIFDIGPTLLARNGIAIPETWEGVDLLGHASRLPEHAYTTGYGVSAARSLDWKLVRVEIGDQLPARDSIGPSGDRLYDLRTDPGETTNVRDLHPEVFQTLQQAMAEYESDVRGEFVVGTRTPLGDETTARLRSLGYID